MKLFCMNDYSFLIILLLFLIVINMFVCGLFYKVIDLYIFIFIFLYFILSINK